MGGSSVGPVTTRMWFSNYNRRWSSSSVWMVLVILAAFRISDILGEVRITELNVPSSVPNGTREPITLDCDYTYGEDDKTGMVVKWFFNKGNAPVYQWIQGQPPSALGILRDRVDLDFKPSKDPFEKHRGIKILQPTTNLTGEWTCRVSTFASEAMSNKRMVVYASETGMDIEMVSRTPEAINISCWADGVYPEPKLTITYKDKKLEDVIHDSTWNDGAYDVRVSAVVPDEGLELPAVFDCELKIPDTSYVTRKQFAYGGPPQLVEEELGNDTSAASGPLLSNVSRCNLITWFNVVLVLAVNMKIFGIS